MFFWENRENIHCHSSQKPFHNKPKLISLQTLTVPKQEWGPPPVLPEIICMATSGALKITDFQIFMLWYYNMLHRSPRCQNYVESLFWLMTRLPRKGFVKLRSGTPFFSSAKSKCLSIFSLLSTFLDNFLISLHVRVKVCDVSRLKSFCDFHGFVLAGSIRHPTKKNFW